MRIAHVEGCCAAIRGGRCGDRAVNVRIAGHTLSEVAPRRLYVSATFLGYKRCALLAVPAGLLPQRGCP
jgi:hypothetical protein